MRNTDAALRRALLAWWDRSRRDMPWRRTRDPYRIWVSEVMLQQTRLDVAWPAWERFVAALPTLRALARADEDEVLSLWSGLGYYGRARSLHRAARLLDAAGERGFPRDAAAARALPGVGGYTAAAVLSIAHGEPLAAVDGNVVRVLSRLGRLARPDGRGEPHRSIADRLLHRRRPGDWNQALMELGQEICRPRAPLCFACPIAGHCAALAAGETDRFPPPKPRRAGERIELDLFVLHDPAGRVLLERFAFAPLPRMWLPVAGRAAARRAAGAATLTPGTPFRHAILHRVFAVRTRAARLPARRLEAIARAPAREPVERRVFAPAELAGIGRSALLTKSLASVGLVAARVRTARAGRRPRVRAAGAGGRG